MDAELQSITGLSCSSSGGMVQLLGWWSYSEEIKNLSYFQQIPTSPLRSCASKTQRPRRQNFGWNEGSACQLLPPVCPLFQLVLFPGKISLCLLKPPPFPLKGLGIHLPFYLSWRDLKGQTQEPENNRFRCSEAVPSVVQTLVEVCNEAELREQIRKKQNIC